MANRSATDARLLLDRPAREDGGGVGTSSADGADDDEEGAGGRTHCACYT